MFRLHYTPGTAAMAPHAALAEVGAEYTLALVEEDELGHRPSEYFSLNPWGQVPTLEDGHLVVVESVAILLHLTDRFPGGGLGPPAGTEARSELYRWLAYLSSAVQAAHMRWYYPERFTDDPAGAAAIRVSATAALRQHVSWIDGELATRPWLVADEPSGADLFLFMLTRWGRIQDPPAWEPPNVRRHFESLLERPSVRRMMSEQGLA
jgi:glutathione S-transferase